MPTMSTKPQPNVGLVEEDECCYPCWKNIPDSITLHIFSFLRASDLYQVGLVSKAWLRVAFDELLWKDLFYRHWGISRSIPLAPGKYSWIQEYKRLLYHTPSVESEVLKQHGDQVLHVSFSHNGKMFATCSKDGFIRVWDTSYPTSLKHKADMRKFTWKYTQFSQFNSTDTLLLVSGVHFGSLSTSGEIAVFSLEGDFVMQSRVMNKPYDVFGTWYSDCYLLSGNLHWTGHLNSCSVLWLNKAYQETMSESESVVMRLFKFSNINASSIRTIMVADCLNQEEGTVCVEKEQEPENQSTSQADVKPLLVGQEVANQSEANKSDKDYDDKMPDQTQKKKSLSKVQSIQVYENGCLCTKFVELEDEDLNDKLNGTIEYSHDYRIAEGPQMMEESQMMENNTDNESNSSRASSEVSLPTSTSIKEKDSSNGAPAIGTNLENIQENFMLGDFSVTSQEVPADDRMTTSLKIMEETPHQNTASDGDISISSYEVATEQNDIAMDILNIEESVATQFSYQVNVDNSGENEQEHILNLEETVLYDVEFDLLENYVKQDIEKVKTESNSMVSDAMDATSSVSHKRTLHGQQQLQGSKFYDPSTSDIENDLPRGESSNSSQSLSVPSSSALCTEQSSFCCVDYKKLRKSTKPNDITVNQTIPMKLEEIPTTSTQGDSEIPGPSSSHSLTHEKRKGSKKHKLKKVVLEESSKACSSDESQSIFLSTKTQTSSQSEDKYLIFTKGSETYTPHQIGIKRIKPLKAFNESGQLLPNVDENTQGLEHGEDYYDEVDHLIDMDGHIIGMCLSPDQRYLYVNSRPWPKNYHIENPLYPPPIAQEIDIHVIDLLRMREVGTMHRAHKAYTSNDECFFIFLDVCDEYVASGAEDKHGYLWDRHYGLCLKKYPHSDVVNSVAFNPMDPEVLVTVSDDFSIKIWRSLSRQKEVINAFNREHCIRLRHVRAIMSDPAEDIELPQE